MKPTLALITLVSFLTLAAPSIVEAQTTYTVSGGGSKNWSTLSPSPDWCTGCVFNIASNTTLVINATTGCTNCTFNGGSVSVTKNFAFTAGIFNGSAVTISNASNYYASSPYGGPTFENGSVTFNVGLTCQACNFINETATMSIPAGGTMTMQASGGYNTTTFNNSTLSMTSTSNTTLLYFNSAVSLTNSAITLTNIKMKSDVGKFALSGSQLYLYGTSYSAPTIGPFALTNTSSIFLGDGTASSTAYLDLSSAGANALQIDATSLVKVGADKNYLNDASSYQYTNSTGTSSSVSTANNQLNCNYSGSSGHSNSCSTNLIYGCATVSSGAVACITLATVDLNLSATAAGPGQVALAFTDAETATADRYQIERNTGNNEWITINTIPAGGYTSGEYRYTDADAPSGTIEYRVARIDQNGKIVYSPISSVTIDQAGSAIGIHPNPATGGTFFITTPYTGEMVVNVFTMTGQLLYRADLKGQTQYAIHLPTQSATLGSVIVQTLGQGGTHTFTVLVR
ncbi:MAG TPA: T9SS type A sorting domain-containing protein [Puia sp.]|nr:T9SS type A sorting domain-containing protein [Puia sp.]